MDKRVFVYVSYFRRSLHQPYFEIKINSYSMSSNELPVELPIEMPVKPRKKRRNAKQKADRFFENTGKKIRKAFGGAELIKDNSMPYAIEQISPLRYKVVNTETGTVHAKSTTLANAKAQIRLLDSLDGGARCCFNSTFCKGTAHYKKAKPSGYKSAYQLKKASVTPPFKSVAKLRGGAITGTTLKKLTESSYKKNKEKPEKIGDLVLDKELSTRKAAVYANPKTGEAVVTHRGTTGTVSDWANNLAMGVGLYKTTDRYKKGKETQKKVNAKYGKENVLTTSHSQSGQLAHELNKEGLVNKSVEINPARLPGQKVLKNETVIKSSFDPVSIFVPEDKRVKVIKAKSMNPIAQHSANIIRGDDATALYGKGMVGTNPSSYTPRGGCMCEMMGSGIPTRFL